MLLTGESSFEGVCVGVHVGEVCTGVWDKRLKVDPMNCLEWNSDRMSLSFILWMGFPRRPWSMTSMIVHLTSESKQP